ncbi:hypothetical protein [Mycolicibacterium fortuitum]|uniref:hypothetical protein n=1 Tax=Mycolicibacterium fortuitum TaxID=1766 RepID=UPI000AD2109A|nr:hypothetical protein [Mycolicibacterium fortuitum]
MSLPLPDPFGPDPAAGGQPGGAPQSWQQQPAGSAGLPPGGLPGGPQQQWAAGTPPPSNGGGIPKWLLGGLAAVLAIALAVVITVLVVKPDSAPSGPSNAELNGSDFEFASANDIGPITVITEDPSCAPWNPIQNTLHGSEDNGWLQRDPTIPSTVWSAEQRAQHDAVAQAMRSAADQTEPLVKLTPHRVMRQLYEQFIAYSRAYADKVPTYTPPDNQLARTGSTAAGLLGDICAAIAQSSAAARAPLILPGPAPNHQAEIGNPENRQLLLTNPDPICPDWETAANRFNVESAEWRKIPSNIPAASWSPEQKATTDGVIPVLVQIADTAQQLGQRTSNPTLQDIAALAEQYLRAFAQALPTYAPSDTHLYDAGRRAIAVVRTACAAAEK